jgi:hypothetical protein
VGRRWLAAACCALLLAAGCTGSSGSSNGGGDGGNGDGAAGPPTSAGAAAPASGYGPATVLGRIADPAIDESSGLAASRRTPGLLWTHNDSGDEPFVYCLDLQGRSCGTFRVTGAEAFDWEDMAAGPGPRAGEPYLYLGDIGDNIDQRTEIVVYRIPEPAAGGGGAAPTRASPGSTAEAEALRFRYPDGTRNAEALLVHPTSGDLYVVTKESPAGVYKAAAPLDPGRVNPLVRVAGVQVGAGGGLDQVTGGDISPDGRRVALCTYAQGYELVLPEDAAGFDAVWAVPPVPVALGPRLQGEAIAYRVDGRALLTTSESSASSLQQVERG